MLNLGGGSPTPSSDVIFDVTDATFMSDVIDASKERPIIVDFWAPWCGPCQQVSPMLEALGADYRGKLRVVKVNVDDNPKLSKTYNI
ncbi:MAG: thioredoxin domain-containing protein, partial [Pseudomonadota bacterium]